MSETDSFIEEVSEEVRRDRLFAFFRKYAWAFGALVVLIVGGAAVNEYLKARHLAEAEATGEAFREAAAKSDTEAFARLAAADAPYAVLAKMDEAALLVQDGKTDEAAAVLNALAADADAGPVYQDMALLKLVMINGQNMEKGELLDILDKLAAPNAPFRLLAMEQRAIANLRLDDMEAVRSDIAQILVDPNATDGLRRRMQQLSISLEGGLSGEAGATSSDG